jgi:hypothetical protein
MGILLAIVQLTSLGACSLAIWMAWKVVQSGVAFQTPDLLVAQFGIPALLWVAGLLLWAAGAAVELLADISSKFLFPPGR